jgi:hypothetical protein
MARFFRAAIFAIFMMAFFLSAGSAFAAGGACPSGADYYNSNGTTLVTLASLGVTNCYYIAANGSDSNDGSSEASPWAHLPGMSTCTGNCSAHTPDGGEGFILRGGDTWNGSNLGINWNWGGASWSSPIYIGVDPTWYSGGSWSRPIWTCPNSSCTLPYYFQANKGYFYLDNIEVPGFFVSSTNTGAYIFGACGGNQIYENIYIHGWNTNVGPIGTVGTGFHVGCGNNVTRTTFRYNIIDGSDSSQNMMTGIYPTAPIAYGNIFRYLVTGIDGPGDIWHDTLVEYLVQSTVTSHQDGLYHVSQYSTPNSLIYNNVVRHTTNPLTGGAVKMWFNGNGPCPYGSAVNACVSYAFNNVVYDNYPGNMIDMGGHAAVNYGTWYFFNNTVSCGTDSVPGNCSLGDNGNTGGTMSVNLINNQWISTATTSFPVCTHYICKESTPLFQTISQAKAQDYADTSNYAFEPASSSAPTVGRGANEDSLCAAVNAIDPNAGAACYGGTTYACTYNSTSHTVSCPTIPAVPRPTGAWDVGAYQFSSTIRASTPQPPQGLAASVQ